MTYIPVKSRRPSTYVYPGSYMPQQSPLGELTDAERLIVARIQRNYDALRAQLVSYANKMINVPFWDLSLDRLFGTGSLFGDSVSKSAGQSVLKAVALFDKRMAEIAAGDYWQADDFIRLVRKAVDAWTQGQPNPTWTDIINAMEVDIKALPHDTFYAIGKFFREAGGGLVEGLGPVGTAVLVGAIGLAGLAGVAYVKGMLPDLSRLKR